ncbi:MAG: glutathione S-transferase family protein [Hydrogenophilaceae bacterium]|jgi:glutathione S-transferase|nr:glutathione S-transferase family protein [Hydrogenophilaceae bacterium]
MKLYVAPYAPNPRRVTMFIAEKGVRDIELVTLNLQEGEHRTEAFRKKSPFAQIPTLELDDGRCLTESRAICAYLEALYPEPNLMGADAFERAWIEMWDRRMELMFTMPLMLWVRHGNPVLAALERNQNADVAQINQAQAMRMAKWLDAELAGRDWVAGDRFTIADITAACGMDFAKMMKWRPGEDLPHLARWRERIGERPAGKVAA